MCLAPFSTILHLYRGDQFYWWRKPKYPDKTTNLSSVTGFQLTTLVVICTDCISSCKSTYHTITTTTAPILNINKTCFWSFLIIPNATWLNFPCNGYLFFWIVYLPYETLEDIKGIVRSCKSNKNRQCNVMSSIPADGEMNSIQHYVIKFVGDLRKVCDFLTVLWCPLPIKLTTMI